MFLKRSGEKNMKQLLLSAMAGVFLISCGTVPSVSVAGGPNLMVFTDDADEDTVPRSSRVHNRVINALRSQMSDSGFDVYDEVAVTGKETEDGEGGYAQGRVRRPDSEILDIAQSLKRPPVDVAVIFQIYASANDKGYTTKVRSRIAGHMLAVQSGQYLGDFEVKKTFNAPADCNRECILEAVGDKSRSLAQDLGDVLAIKLAHLVNDSGSSANDGGVATGGGDALTKKYTLVFNNFTPDERLDIEEYLVVFSGYKSHRPTDCSRRSCEYWYESTISSAKLNRNLKRMLDQLGSDANIQFRGNTYILDKITLRKKGNRAVPQGSDW